MNVECLTCQRMATSESVPTNGGNDKHRSEVTLEVNEGKA